ncbi:hypothetical protein GIB67_007214 [Kingdonia uniflora]|uniref:porphobilinogen synthase n=1 Tax=Kingdonia uniflora TaxID=39325 RepID=A0A7J7NX85_9MAGN|nr:hypothetical protein GIB67_007214 [Kingdonia uniflora]
MIRNKIGEHVRDDLRKRETEPLRNSFVRILVNLFTKKTLVTSIPVLRPDSYGNANLSVRYERLEGYCSLCGLIPHTLASCAHFASLKHDRAQRNSDEPIELPFGKRIQVNPPKLSAELYSHPNRESSSNSPSQQMPKANNTTQPSHGYQNQEKPKQDNVGSFLQTAMEQLSKCPHAGERLVVENMVCMQRIEIPNIEAVRTATHFGKHIGAFNAHIYEPPHQSLQAVPSTSRDTQAQFDTSQPYLKDPTRFSPSCAADPEEAETIAVIRGLEVSRGLGLQRILLLSDFQRLLRTFRERPEDLSWGALTLAPDLRAIAACFLDFSFDYVDRRCNYTAHFLAARGVGSLVPRLFEALEANTIVNSLPPRLQATRGSTCRVASAEEGEALAVMEGILWARKRGIPRVNIETDAEAISLFCENGAADVFWTTKAILQDCMNLFSSFVDICISYVPRSATFVMACTTISIPLSNVRVIRQFDCQNYLCLKPTTSQRFVSVSNGCKLGWRRGLSVRAMGDGQEAKLKKLGLSDEECEASVVAGNIPETPPVPPVAASPAGTPVDSSLPLNRRPRRNRRSPVLRASFQETSLTPANFVYPLFIHEGEEDTPIGAMPGCYRLGWRHGLIEEDPRCRKGSGCWCQ